MIDQSDRIDATYEPIVDHICMNLCKQYIFTITSDHSVFVHACVVIVAVVPGSTIDTQ
jgi:hypothetical protein